MPVVPMSSTKQFRWICTTGNPHGSCCLWMKLLASRKLAQLKVKKQTNFYKPFWSSGSTTLDLLNDWCWISKCLSCPMKLERSSSALESTAAHAEPQRVPVQNNTPERALLNDMFN